jgi:hypothetical protein
MFFVFVGFQALGGFRSYTENLRINRFLHWAYVRSEEERKCMLTYREFQVELLSMQYSFLFRRWVGFARIHRIEG